MHIDICHPSEISNRIDSADSVIVIDALRASATITMLLEAGATCVRPVTDRENILDEEAVLTVGEHQGERLDGFDLDNSPRRVKQKANNIAGKRATILTTNGTQCVDAVKHAKTVLIGTLLNKRALVSFCKTRLKPLNVWLVPAHRHGSYAPEDHYTALQLREEFARHGVSIGDLHDDDAESLRRKNAETVFQESETGKYLIGLGKESDVSFCAQSNICGAVPLLDEEQFVDATETNIQATHHQ